MLVYYITTDSSYEYQSYRDTSKKQEVFQLIENFLSQQQPVIVT